MTWWADLYDDLLADVLLTRADAAETERTLALLTEVLALGPRSRVFDQCCGIGSLSVPLARRGHDVVGVDLMPGYVARANAAAEGTSARHEAADAFSYAVKPACDAAYNWWTSFGYAERDEDNRRMLERAFESLRPGGRFALDFMNAYQVVRHFAPDVVTERVTPRGRVTLWRRSTLDPAAGVIHKVWSYLLPGGDTVRRESRVRLYFPHELQALLQAAGFEAVRFVGDLEGGALSAESPRCIAVARRPA
ncbi:MAG: methyltransferase domain-containing protein [Myxococcales bacterium]|nr:methyltransferase domain-containing protein [Myxococcales bacterium]